LLRTYFPARHARANIRLLPLSTLPSHMHGRRGTKFAKRAQVSTLRRAPRSRMLVIETGKALVVEAKGLGRGR